MTTRKIEYFGDDEEMVSVAKPNRARKVSMGSLRAGLGKAATPRARKKILSELDRRFEKLFRLRMKA